MELELVRGERLAQVLLEFAALLGLVLEVGRIEAERAAPAVLGGVEREIGGADDFFALDPVVGATASPIEVPMTARPSSSE
jgi:hypothetical protein